MWYRRNIGRVRIIGSGMYQGLVIGEADASRLEQNREKNRSRSRNDAIRPDRMIICGNWPTTLSTFG